MKFLEIWKKDICLKIPNYLKKLAEKIKEKQAW